MNRLQKLKAEKMRLEMELSTLAEGASRSALLIDIASIDNEIIDIEWEVAHAA